MPDWGFLIVFLVKPNNGIKDIINVLFLDKKCYISIKIYEDFLAL